MKRIQLLLTCLCLSLVNPPSRADELINDSGLWSQVEGHFKLETFHPKLHRFRLWTTGEARFFDDFGRFSQGVVRIVPGYQFSEEIALFFGYTWQPTVLRNGKTLDEHDINQAMKWATKTDWGTVSTRSMIEWRFVDNDSQMATRLRQKVRAGYRLHPHLSLIAWEELFVNVYSVDWGPESGIDQNRLFAGFGWQFDRSGHYTFEVGYMNQYISLPNRDDLMNHMALGSLQIRY
ncbi:DUF2490 domain-containing protein [Methylomarinum sp. Ch1-1]|uniref:DUF2490 domain-containing protein n=1 Tax=Methylomarinum roseum TaxID=3067653 RepID=A0AAU7NTN5_9GAMM|nr:DUF2490 domain-containing protein [Methylomarinum sp. Ch1-1]MDP4519557.1 DUF2490 domain-containing protein [Methylomarinum sp. Ch1-1]